MLILRDFFKRKKWVFTQESSKAISCAIAIKSCNIELYFLFRFLLFHGHVEESATLTLVPQKKIPVHDSASFSGSQ